MKIAIVGNSPSILNYKWGKEIDSHDIIIRFNNYNIKGFEEYVGSKTTHIVLACLDKLFSRLTINNFLSVPKENRWFKNNYKHEDSYKVCFKNRVTKDDCIEFDKELCESFNNLLEANSSTGLFVMNYIIMCYPKAEINAYGFAFFKEKNIHYFEKADLKWALQYHEPNKEEQYFNDKLSKFITLKKLYKTAVCAIAKQENNYIREFVEHYKSLGFDNILLYDNNDIDGETFNDVIGDYINSGYVKLHNYRGKTGTIEWSKNFYSILNEAYNECYHTYENDFDWILFVDIDELLMFDENYSHINDVLNLPIYSLYNAIRIAWKYYDDNDLVTVENNNYSFKRFTRWNTSNVDGNNRMGKIIARTKLHIEPNYAHGFASDKLYGDINKKNIKICNTGGMTLTNIDCFVYGTNKYKYMWLNHYRYKTIEEYVLKMKRRWPDTYQKSGENYLTIQTFFRNNKRTKEKTLYIHDNVKVQKIKSIDTINITTTTTTTIAPVIAYRKSIHERIRERMAKHTNTTTQPNNNNNTIRFSLLRPSKISERFKNKLLNNEK